MKSDTEFTFDMKHHAIVMAVPFRFTGGRRGLGTPAFLLNGGDTATLVLALRAAADDLESGGLDKAMEVRL